jgi:hypothetical protein
MAADAPAQKSKALDTNATLVAFSSFILGLRSKGVAHIPIYEGRVETGCREMKINLGDVYSLSPVGRG